MRRLIFAAILAVVFPISGMSTDLNAEWSQTIDASEMGANIRDTFYTDVLNTSGLDFTYHWRTVIIGGYNVIDTVFGGDTLYIMTQHSPSGVGDWSLFDSVKIILNGNPDTTLAPWKRINHDSATYCGNYWRVKLVNGMSVGVAAADTAIIGNSYGYDVKVWFEGKP